MCRWRCIELIHTVLLFWCRQHSYTCKLFLRAQTTHGVAASQTLQLSQRITTSRVWESCTQHVTETASTWLRQPARDRDSQHVTETASTWLRQPARDRDRQCLTDYKTFPAGRQRELDRQVWWGDHPGHHAGKKALSLSLSLYIYIYIYIHIYIYAYTCTCIHIRKHTRTCTYTHMYLCIYIQDALI